MNGASEAYAAVPIRMSCALASVITDITVEKATTNPNTSHAIDSLLIGTRNRRSTGVRSIPTARDMEMALMRIANRSLA